MNPHAAFLFRLVECLSVPFAWERSVRFAPRALLPNRFLLTVTKTALGKEADDTILSLCRRLDMPEAGVKAAQQNLPAARHIHFGFEEDESRCLYKVYLEFAPSKSDSDPFMLHLACKWDIGERTRHVLTQYVLYPGLSVANILRRLTDIYRGADGASLHSVQGILNLAAARPGHNIAYLEVTEATNQRRSFDLNMYDTCLPLQDLKPYILRMGEHFSVPRQQVLDFLEPIKTLRFGHLAGGIHRGGQGFFNLYYGAERRQGKARSGFSEDPSPSLQPYEGTPALWTTSAPATRERSLSQNLGETMNAVEHFEITTPQDQYYNYCWWPYMPVAPAEGKWRPVNLLLSSFALAGLDQPAWQLVQRIREAIGPFRTVYGVKWVANHLAWEFYFYDYQRRQREVSITRVLQTIRPLLRCDVPVNESLPYFMFSLDVSEELLAGTRDLDVVHMYIGNPGSRVSSGIAYAVTAQATILENFYFFFEAKRDLRQAAEKIYCSAHVDAARMDIDCILRPELRDCNTICVANKQRNDTAYFSGVNVDQLLFFLNMLEYPPPLIGFVEQNHAQLDHLLYDVGFDYVAKGDELVMVKSGFYGVF